MPTEKCVQACGVVGVKKGIKNRREREKKERKQVEKKRREGTTRHHIIIIHKNERQDAKCQLLEVVINRMWKECVGGGIL